MAKLVPTPHNAAEYGEIARSVIMSGDPLRAKYVAEHYLDNPVEYNSVRGMLGFTGTYNGKKISVQGHGMGIPSIGIYSYELYNFYDVDTIIRAGTCGSPDPEIPIGTLVLAESACTDSTYGYQYGLPAGHISHADPSLLARAVALAETRELTFRKGRVFSSDVFYDPLGTQKEILSSGIAGVEMESHALYVNAAYSGKKALTILTVTDNLATDEHLSAAERQSGMGKMLEFALELA